MRGHEHKGVNFQLKPIHHSFKHLEELQIIVHTVKNLFSFISSGKNVIEAVWKIHPDRASHGRRILNEGGSVKKELTFEDVTPDLGGNGFNIFKRSFIQLTYLPTVL